MPNREDQSLEDLLSNLSPEDIKRAEKILKNAKKREKEQELKELASNLIRIIKEAEVTKSQAVKALESYNPQDDEEAKMLGYKYKDNDGNYEMRDNGKKQLTPL